MLARCNLVAWGVALHPHTDGRAMFYTRLVPQKAVQERHNEVGPARENRANGVHATTEAPTR